ncbi:hypothetical protein JTB14_035396 [Gonioctena quinquepunctata]|nr:hypothetical protein JTB14_035396 [Gonioctena quinquepunctata]
MLIEEVNSNFGQRIEKIKEVTNNSSTAIHTEVKKDKTEVEHLEEENQQLINRLYRIERIIVTNNLVFYGILEASKEQPENLEKKVRELVIEKLRVSLERTEIKNIFRLEKQSNQKTHPTISNNLPQEAEETEKRLETKKKKILLEELKEARNNSPKATIKGNKLIVGDRTYSVTKVQNTLSNEEDELSNISTRKISGEPPTPSPKEFVIEEEETIITTKASLIQTKLAEGSRHSNEERIVNEEWKTQSNKFRQLSINDPPKKKTAFRTLRTQEK